MASLWSLRLMSRVVVACNNACIRKDGTINRKREEFFWGKVAANPKPVNGVSTIDAVVDCEKGVWVRLFIPAHEPCGNPKPQSQKTKTMPVIFYYHGGGFVIHSPDSAFYDAFCRRLARKCRALVISVHYRRAPEHKFPVAYEDCYSALEWLQYSGEATKCLPPNTDLSRVYLSGDDAGGNIAHHVAIRAVRKNTSPLVVKGLLLLSPLFGGRERTPAEIRYKKAPIVSVESLDWFWKAYLPPGSDRDHPACNVFGANSRLGDLAGVPFPPVLVIIGGLDILQDWEMRYTDCLDRAGKDVSVLFYKEGIHSFGVFNQVCLAKQMFLDVAAFIDSH